jgi:hypothetical protein
VAIGDPGPFYEAVFLKKAFGRSEFGVSPEKSPSI